jgi:hypothetical protein
MYGRQPVIAIDTKAEYKEIDKGKVKTGVNTIRLNYISDWVLAIGNFGV